MTETGPEPTNADLLAFMQQAFSHLTTELGKTNAIVGQIAEGQRVQGRAISEASAELGQVSADVSVLRDRYAQINVGVSAVRDDVRQVRADIAGVKTEMGFVEQYHADVQEAVVRHLNDPDAHGPRRAA